MSQKIQSLITQLQQQLCQPLPGTSAHQRLMPEIRRRYPENPDLAAAMSSSVMALFFEQTNDIRLVFIQRPLYDGVHSGQIAFPGGRTEKSDADTCQTALRETEEETGISAKDIKVIGQLSDLYIPPSNFLVHPFVGYLTHEPHFVPDPVEVQEVFTIKLDDLLRPDAIKMRTVTGANYTAEVPCFFIDNRLIWGATSMILSELIMVIQR
ncbi:MAG TPA: CoA pyrophosphatase [Bacteroidales bacterium]|nr:CoA pyrophosphatase [Bacteroidales bacterium]